MSLENTRLKNMIIDPFSEEEKQKAQEQKPPIQENTAETMQKPPIQENTTEKPKITLEDFADKEFLVRTVSISKNNLAFIKVMSKLEHTTQQDYLDKIINDFKNNLNLGDDIKQKIKNQQNAL